MARYGGEEFALILPATDEAGSRYMAARVRRAIADLEGLARPITVSAGIATAPPTARAEDTSGALLSAADAALYRARQAGRDRAAFAAMPEDSALLTEQGMTTERRKRRADGSPAVGGAVGGVSSQSV